MATHRNRELEDKIESLLKSPVRSKAELANLFCKLLGFEYVGRALSNRDKETWGESEVARIAADQNFEILARHGDVASGGFAILYGELKPFNLSIQRTLILQLRKRFPAALFLFAQWDTIGHARGARLHLIHAKISGPPSGDDASQRLILRRFRIGPGERYRTASERLAKLDLNARPHIGTLELGHICDEAFDKEALTDEFFKKLDRHIRAIETDLRNNQPDLDAKEAFTQSQLLLERLVFLYFAQNRGWLNQDPEFLIKNFAKYKKDGDGFGYYQEFLHRLFRSLAEPSFGDRLEGIPFLNGGLFDDDEFRPPQSKLRIRNETFAALFNDLFEAYNFTVREDTPLSQEVAVDPEMLGKIFESIVLHRESAGTEYQAPNLRKATGSNYTPRIWESAGGDFAKAVALIPADWPKPRRALWETRLAAIRDNEHIRRIEQPVYKRRWDEQWKVSNRWMAGPVAYAQEFVDAFRWWLAEKAEYLLEHKAAGGPVELGGWTPALRKDKRIEAAWPVVADAIHQVGQFKFDASENEAKKLTALDASYESFAKFLKDTVADETVPAGIPPAVSWDDLAAKKKWTTAQLKKAAAVRGKLNVPRERFQLTAEGEFVWAGRVRGSFNSILAAK